MQGKSIARTSAKTPHAAPRAAQRRECDQRNVRNSATAEIACIIDHAYWSDALPILSVRSNPAPVTIDLEHLAGEPNHKPC